MLVVCEVCGKEVNRKPSHITRSKNNFCSKECHDLFRRDKKLNELNERFYGDFKKWLSDRYLIDMLTTRKISLLVYGRETNFSSINEYLKRFDIPLRKGSEAIKTQWINADERREKTSEMAKENLNNKEVREKIKKTQQTKEYKQKMSVNRLGKLNPMYGVIGESHPNWNPNLTDEERKKLRKSIDDSIFRRKVLRRDKYTCQKCRDSKGGNLNVHHIKNHSEHKELRYDVSNGITFCETCHIVFHKQYGYKNNDENQIKEFLFVTKK